MSHSLVFCGTAIILSTMSLTGFSFAHSVLVSLLAISVAAIGLPHGGLDLKKGSELVQANLGIHSKLLASFLFVIMYLGLATVVTLGWFYAPIVTISVFFLLSAWHFGLEEEEDISISKSGDQFDWSAHLGIAVRGGLVIWLPCVFAKQSVTDTLATVMPAYSDAAGIVVSFIANLWPAFVVLLAYDVVRHFNTLPRPEFKSLAGRLFCSAILFASCPILVSFVVYFCGWHSIRGLIHLRREFIGNTRQFIATVLPLTLATIGLFGVGLFYFVGNNFVTSNLITSSSIRTIFIGLSAIAIPHLCLHVLADVLQEKSDRGLTPIRRQREAF